MNRQRAADDYKTIRARMEELRRESRRDEAIPAIEPGAPAIIPGHRGPCACGMSLFLDECDGACKAL